MPAELDFPDYKPPLYSTKEILFSYFVPAAVIFLVVFVYSGRKPHLSTTERLMTCWFVISGLTHGVVEGTYVATPGYQDLAGGNILIDTWKEYTKADSRYATRDAFVVAMEAVTAAAWGPGCLAVALGLLLDAPWCLPLQLLVSLGQLYGDVLYYATCWLEGLRHSRGEALYFWGYFVAMNAIWVVVPSLIIARGVRNLTQSVRLAKAAGPNRKKRQ